MNEQKPNIPVIEDRQLIQIVIENETNGREFEFSSEYLCKEIIVKGYALYHNLTLADYYNWAQTRGFFNVDIEWLKVDGVSLTSAYTPKHSSTLELPWNYSFQQDYDFPADVKSNAVTSNLNMNLRLTLPQQTSLRKRFKATAMYSSVSGVTESLSTVKPLGFVFKLVLYLEVVHDHVFR